MNFRPRCLFLRIHNFSKLSDEMCKQEGCEDQSTKRVVWPLSVFFLISLSSLHCWENKMGSCSNVVRSSDTVSLRESSSSLVFGAFFFFFCSFILTAMEYMKTTPAWGRNCQGKSPEDVTFGWVVNDGGICHLFLWLPSVGCPWHISHVCCICIFYLA